MIVDKFAWGLDVRFAFLHFLSFILFVQQRVSSLHFDGTCFVSWVCLYFMLAFPFLYLLLLNVKKWLEKLCVGREGEEERIRPGENKKTRCFQFFNIHIQNSLFLYISIVDDKSYNIFFLKTQKNVHLCALIFVFVMICLDTVHGCKSEQFLCMLHWNFYGSGAHGQLTDWHLSVAHVVYHTWAAFCRFVVVGFFFLHFSKAWWGKYFFCCCQELLLLSVAIFNNKSVIPLKGMQPWQTNFYYLWTYQCCNI